MQEPKAKGTLEYVHSLHPFKPTSSSPSWKQDYDPPVVKILPKVINRAPIEIVYDAETNAPISFTKSVWTSKEGRLNMDAKTLLGMGTGSLNISKSNENSTDIEKKNDLVQLFHSKGPLVPIFHKKWSAKTGNVDYDIVNSSNNSVNESIQSEKQLKSNKSVMSTVVDGSGNGSRKNSLGQLSAIWSSESNRVSPLMFEDMTSVNSNIKSVNSNIKSVNSKSKIKTNFIPEPVLPRKQSLTSHVSSSLDGRRNSTQLLLQQQEGDGIGLSPLVNDNILMNTAYVTTELANVQTWIDLEKRFYKELFDMLTTMEHNKRLTKELKNTLDCDRLAKEVA